MPVYNVFILCLYFCHYIPTNIFCRGYKRHYVLDLNHSCCLQQLSFHSLTDFGVPCCSDFNTRFFCLVNCMIFEHLLELQVPFMLTAFYSIFIPSFTTLKASIHLIMTSHFHLLSTVQLNASFMSIFFASI